MASVVYKLSKAELRKCISVEEYMLALHRKTHMLGGHEADTRPMVTLSMCSAMGRGLCTSRTFEEGDLVLAERALVPIHEQGGMFLNAKAFALAISSEDNRTALPVVRDMHNSYHGRKEANLFNSDNVEALGPDAIFTVEEMNHIAGVYCTNAHRFSGLGGTEKCGMMPMTAMVNHSCAPNIELKEIEHMPNILHGEYTTWRIYYMGNTLHGEYTAWRI